MEGNEVIVRLPKCVLAMSRERFIECLRQGKRWRRQQSLAQRLTTSAQEPRGATDQG
jgi:hypothetical protein